MSRLSELLVDFLFPKRCVGCNKIGSFICLGCRQGLLRVSLSACPVCGRPQISSIVCPSCLQVQAEIDGIRSVFHFEGAMRKAIHQLKYHNLKAIAPCLAELVAEYLRANQPSGDVLVPVPLHPRRLKERGYNQSSLLARGLGVSMNLPVMEDCLIRVRESQPQVKAVSLDQRKEHVEGAFLCQDGRIRGKGVILVDDVCTSGATLQSCAKALKRKGATSVWGITLAREI